MASITPQLVIDLGMPGGNTYGVMEVHGLMEAVAGWRCIVD
jgi:hypothetical protein